MIYYTYRAVTKKKTNIECTSKKEDVKAAKVDENESDYYMTENPIYNMAEPATMTTQAPYYAQVNKTAQVIQNVEDIDNNTTSGVYHLISDSPNDATQPLMSETSQETNINDTQKSIDTECEYTEIGHDEDVTISMPSG